MAQIVEDPDARIGETMEEILELVRNSLDQPAAGEEDVTMNGVTEAIPASRVPQPSGGQAYAEEEVWNEYAGGDEFVDDGEGAGVEGDLDVEDD